LALIYYRFSISIAEQKFALDLAQNVFIKRLPSAITDPCAYIFIANKILRALTPSGIVLVLIGLLNIKRNQLIILVFFCSMAAEVLFVVSVIRIYYYLVFFTVPCCILIGNGLKYLYDFPKMRLLSIFILCFMIE
jgi:hypothetical protein